jgi:hypothetical protein
MAWFWKNFPILQNSKVKILCANRQRNFIWFLQKRWVETSWMSDGEVAIG